MIRAWLLEIRRRPRRFGPLTTALAALAFLALAVGGLADGLLLASTGALRNTDADLYVYADVAQGSAVGSVLPQALTAPAIHVPGVAGAGPVTYVPTTAELEGSEGVGVVVVGFSQAFPGQPSDLAAGRLPRDGEPGVAAVDGSLLEADAGLGDTVRVAGERDLEIVGILEDAGYLLQPSVWVPPYEAVRARASAWPEMGIDEDLGSLLAVRLLDGTDPDAVAAELDETLEETATLTAEQAYRAIPGVGAQQSTLRVVVAITVAGAAVVSGLFVALLAVDKRRLLRTLGALGGSARAILGGGVVQAVTCGVGGILIAGFAVGALAAVLPGLVPFALRPGTVAMTIAGLLATTAGGALLAGRALLRAADAA